MIGCIRAAALDSPAVGPRRGFHGGLPALARCWTGIPGLNTFAIVVITFGVISGVALAVAPAVAMRKDYLASRAEADPVHLRD
jgi:hypothetical protein